MQRGKDARGKAGGLNHRGTEREVGKGARGILRQHIYSVLSLNVWRTSIGRDLHQGIGSAYLNLRGFQILKWVYQAE